MQRIWKKGTNIYLQRAPTNDQQIKNKRGSKINERECAKGDLCQGPLEPKCNLSKHDDLTVIYRKTDTVEKDKKRHKGKQPTQI